MNGLSLPKTAEEWDLWEVEESKKDNEYIDALLETDPNVLNSVHQPNSSKPFNAESFKETTRRLTGVLALD